MPNSAYAIIPLKKATSYLVKLVKAILSYSESMSKTNDFPWHCNNHFENWGGGNHNNYKNCKEPAVNLVWSLVGQVCKVVEPLIGGP